VSLIETPRVIQTRRSRQTGTLVEVIDDRDGSFGSGGSWATVCVDHGGICSHDTRALALDFAPVPNEWCPTCQELSGVDHETPGGAAVSSLAAAGDEAGAADPVAPSIHRPKEVTVSSTTTTPAPAKKKAAPPEGITVAALVDALKEAGVVAKPKWNPKRTYARLMVAGKNIGYVDAPNTKGMKVVPAVTHDELKNGVKKAHKALSSSSFGASIMVADEKGLANAVAGLVAADSKRQAKASA
jgi:hypothetical protein